MAKPYRGVVLLVSLAVLITIAATVVPPLVERAVGARPDPAAYTAYVNRYVGGWSSSTDPRGHVRDEEWARSHPRAILIEGGNACQWLVRQPWAPRVDPTGDSMVGSMTLRYLREARGEPPMQMSRMGMFTVVAGAWQYLCRFERDAKTAPKTLDED